MDKEWRPSEKKTDVSEKPTHKPRVDEWSAPEKKTLPGWWWIPLAALAVIILAFAFLGNDATPRCGGEEAQGTAEITTLEARLASCEEALEIKAEPVAVDECSDTAFTVLRRDLAQCRTDLGLTEEEIDEHEETFEEQEATIADAARRICCAQRIENNVINSYDVEDNKIVCTTDSGTPISC